MDILNERTTRSKPIARSLMCSSKIEKCRYLAQLQSQQPQGGKTRPINKARISAAVTKVAPLKFQMQIVFG